MSWYVRQWLASHSFGALQTWAQLWEGLRGRSSVRQFEAAFVEVDEFEHGLDRPGG